MIKKVGTINFKELSALVEMRREMYNVLSSLFLAPPTKELIDLFIHSDLSEELEDILGNVAIANLKNFRENFNGSYEDVKQEYRDLFIIPLGKYVTPYESVYRGEKKKGLLMGPFTLDVKRFYKRISADIEDNKQLPDHIGVELGILHFLCKREKEFLEKKDEKRVVEMLRLQKEFLQKHLLCWLPDLCEKIFEKTKNNFYLAIAKITLDFVRSDSNTLTEILGCI